MKTFRSRILLAAAATLAMFVLRPSARAQQADEDPPPTASHPSQSNASPQTSQHDGKGSSSDAVQTQDTLAFTGRVVQEQGQLILKDPVTKMSYRLDSQNKAKPYLGKQVKVTGKLEMKSNTIHIDSIEPVS